MVTSMATIEVSNYEELVNSIKSNDTKDGDIIVLTDSIEISNYNEINVTKNITIDGSENKYTIYKTYYSTDPSVTEERILFNVNSKTFCLQNIKIYCDYKFQLLVDIFIVFV